MTRGGLMDNGPEQRDEEIRAAIDELNEAQQNVRRVREEGERWQQENLPPKERIGQPACKGGMAWRMSNTTRSAWKRTMAAQR